MKDTQEYSDKKILFFFFFFLEFITLLIHISKEYRN